LRSDEATMDELKSTLTYDYGDYREQQHVCIINNQQDCYKFAACEVAYVTYGDGLWDATIINFLSSRIRG
jgi:hypothetical protein